MNTKHLSFLACAALLSAPAHAAITYIDAAEGSTGNTLATGSTLSDTSWVGPGDSGTNNSQWNKRAFGNGGTIFQGRYDDDGSNFPELTTEITGLSDGTYDVWVFFWDSANTGPTQTWNIAAGLTSGSLTTYSFDGAGNTTAPVDAGTLSFTTTVLTTEGTEPRTLYGVNLGQGTVSGGSAIEVFIDNLTGGGGSGVDRTWYDGVGYEVIPEPSTTLLVGLLGSICLIRRRR